MPATAAMVRLHGRTWGKTIRGPTGHPSVYGLLIPVLNSLDCGNLLPLPCCHMNRCMFRSGYSHEIPEVIVRRVLIDVVKNIAPVGWPAERLEPYRMTAPSPFPILTFYGNSPIWPDTLCSDRNSIVGRLATIVRGRVLPPLSLGSRPCDSGTNIPDSLFTELPALKPTADPLTHFR